MSRSEARRARDRARLEAFRHDTLGRYAPTLEMSLHHAVLNHGAHGAEYPVSGDATAVVRAQREGNVYPVIGGPLHGKLMPLRRGVATMVYMDPPTPPAWDRALDPVLPNPKPRMYRQRRLFDGRTVLVAETYTDTPDARPTREDPQP